jgi:hypothetical protein
MIWSSVKLSTNAGKKIGSLSWGRISEEGGWRMEDGGWRMEEGGGRREEGGGREGDCRLGLV